MGRLTAHFWQSNVCRCSVWSSSCRGSNYSLRVVILTSFSMLLQDLEYLIKKCVNPATADFAVVAGVQVRGGGQLPAGLLAF